MTSLISLLQKQQQQAAANAEGGGQRKKKVTAAQLRVQKGTFSPLAFYEVVCATHPARPKLNEANVHFVRSQTSPNSP